MGEDTSQELQKAKDRANFLYEVSRVVSSSRYLEEILLLVVGLTAQVTGSKICSLMLYDEKKKELTIKATQSLSDNYLKKPPIKVGQSVSGKALLLGKPVVIADVTLEKDYQYPDVAREENVKSLAAVPMMVKDKSIGVINCYTAEEYEFSKEDLQILMAVASQAAMAIENTKLLADNVIAFEQLETRKVVDRAKGILMKKKGITENEAYRLIQKQSMDKRKSLKGVAEAILFSEDLN